MKILRLLKEKLLRRLAIRERVAHGRNLHVGPGSVIWAPRSLEMGNDVYIGKNVTIEVDGIIGDNVLIANMVGIVGRRDHDIHEVGSGVRHSRWVGDFPDDLSDPVVVGSDVWIGFGATVLSGVVIGDHVVVGAGSLVTSDIPENSIAIGRPARVVSKRFAPEDLARHRKMLNESGIRLVASEGHRNG